MEYMSPAVVANGVDLLSMRGDVPFKSIICSVGVALMLVAAAVAIWGLAVVEGAAAVTLIGAAGLALAVYGVTSDC